MSHSKFLPTKLNASRTLFLLCDVQEKFRTAIPLFGNMIQNINKLLQTGKAFEVPLIATEQYPKGLGKTIKEFDVSQALAVIPKTKFTMYVPELECYIKELVPEKPHDVVLFGLETHVCVLQTAVDFLENDYKVHIVADCIASRLNQDRDIGLKLMRQIGCFVQTSESVIFSLAQDKENPQFDLVKNAVRAVSTDMEIAKVVHKPKKSSRKKMDEKKTNGKNADNKGKVEVNKNPKKTAETKEDHKKQK